ncbi:MFS transporter [Sphingomonas canadensis]|uniref:MFS transporter n=1 Tax=Sphingomonas canadensis TaxID=1219257 RepID=A0ABW3H6H3_9SPHN|nr:MFS transporter [Sphingomonas canadensis]MCW3836795.1 MFS transporter [Sphingomonas canadensis]
MAMRSDANGSALTPALLLLMALACGSMSANLYYAQTLIDQIGPEIGLSHQMAGTITTLTQLGYGAGLALLVPLSDLVENKRLVLIATGGAILGCLGIALSGGAADFLAFSLLTGLCCCGAQVLVPLAAHLSAPERQGQSVGLVMSGLLTGVMLARPAASFIASLAGWRWVFFGSAGLLAVVALSLALMLPGRRPPRGPSYGAILASVVALAARHRQLRLRAIYQALMFGAFNLFWTAAPLTLLNDMGLSQRAVAAFALAGAGGVLVAPLAGWLSDRGLMRGTTLAGFAILALSFLAADAAVAAGSVLVFAVTAILVDGAVQMSQVTGQRIIFAIDPAARGRINAVYMTVMFGFGGLGSLIGTATYAAGGWHLSALAGAAMGGVALALMLAIDRPAKDGTADCGG